MSFLWLDSNTAQQVANSNGAIDPFCKQAWIEYGRRFCIYSVTGLAVGAACAFVFMGLPLPLLFHSRETHVQSCFYGARLRLWYWLCVDAIQCGYPQPQNSQEVEK